MVPYYGSRGCSTESITAPGAPRPSRPARHAGGQPRRSGLPPKASADPARSEDEPSRDELAQQLGDVDEGGPVAEGSGGLSALVEAAKLPPVRLHDLRHGAASLMLAAGVPMKVAKETLGHSGSSILTGQPEVGPVRRA
jgi:integrase